MDRLILYLHNTYKRTLSIKTQRKIWFEIWLYEKNQLWSWSVTYSIFFISTDQALVPVGNCLKLHFSFKVFKPQETSSFFRLWIGKDSRFKHATIGSRWNSDSGATWQSDWQHFPAGVAAPGDSPGMAAGCCFRKGHLWCSACPVAIAPLTWSICWDGVLAVKSWKKN